MQSQTLSMAVIIFGVVVQLLILALLIIKRLAHKFPALSLTMIFFVLRTGLTYSAQHYSVWMLTKLPRETWAKVFNGINIAEDALQAAIVVELVLWLLPALSAYRKRIWWRLYVGAAVAIGFVGAILYMLKYTRTAAMTAHGITTATLAMANAHIAIVACTAALVMLSAFAVVSMKNDGGTPVQWLASKFGLGWGIFGSVNLTALAAYHRAMLTMDRSLIFNMQYIVTGTYVLMMTLWVCALLFFKNTPPPSRDETIGATAA